MYKIVRNADIPFSFVNDNNLSLRAKGLLSWLMANSSSCPEVSLDDMVNGLKENVTAIKTTLKELKSLGYLEVKKYYPERGVRSTIDFEHTIYENPVEQTIENEVSDTENTSSNNTQQTDAERVCEQQVENNSVAALSKFVNYNIYNKLTKSCNRLVSKDTNHFQEKSLKKCTLKGTRGARRSEMGNQELFSLNTQGITQVLEKPIPKITKDRAPNIYSRCMDAICEHQKLECVRRDLGDYLSFLLSQGVIKGVPQWRARLKKLTTLASDEDTLRKIVLTATERGWRSFYPVNDGTRRWSGGFNEGIRPTKSKLEVTKEERLAAMARDSEGNLRVY